MKKRVWKTGAVCGLAALCLSGCQGPGHMPDISVPTVSESAALEELLKEGGGVLYTGTDFDIQVYPVELLQKNGRLYFTYTLDLFNKHQLAYKKLNVMVMFHEDLHPYFLDGPDYLGEIPLKGKDGRIYEEYGMTGEKEINPEWMQRERGVPEDELVLTPEDVDILRGKPATALMTIEARKDKWEIPFTLTYKGTPDTAGIESSATPKESHPVRLHGRITLEDGGTLSPQQAAERLLNDALEQESAEAGEVLLEVHDLQFQLVEPAQVIPGTFLYEAFGPISGNQWYLDSITLQAAYQLGGPPEQYGPADYTILNTCLLEKAGDAYTLELNLPVIGI